MAMLSKEQRRFLDSAAMRYLENLDDAGDWLGVRGIELDFARRSGLGVVRDPATGHESARGRLSIPYLTQSGVVAISFRCLQDHNCKEFNHSKYWKPSGTHNRLYGSLWMDEADDFLCLTEGEMDALTLIQAGLPALGVPGSEAWQDHWTPILHDFSRIYVFSDGDDPGQKFAKKVISEYDRAVNIRMPDGEDVNSAFVKWGKEFLTEKIGEK